MRWKNRTRSSNVEDRRGQQAMRIGGGSSSLVMRLLPMLISKLGLKGVLAIGAGLVVANMMGVDIPALLSGQVAATSTSSSASLSAQDQQRAEFTSVVLADTEETWHTVFAQLGKQYPEPKLVLFTGAVQSACGFAEAAMGPFYCPGDKQIYIDLSFYSDLQQRHGAPGDFAQAYVIAHEVGHHVQTVLGISQKIQNQKQQVSNADANQLSVRQELQADCFSGIWGYHADKARNLLEQGDIEEALVAAAAIGDDRLQKQARGYVTPESFTHGTSAQRIRWFKTGFRTGNVQDCDTFSVSAQAL